MARRSVRYRQWHVRTHSSNGVQAALATLEALDETAQESWPIACWLAHRSTTKPRSCHLSAPALQTYFTRLAATLDVALVEHCDIPGICPVCASRPVASVLRIGGEQANLRYLVCSLCATEWNMSRIQCTSCDTDKGVKYLVLQAEGESKRRARGAR